MVVYDGKENMMRLRTLIGLREREAIATDVNVAEPLAELAKFLGDDDTDVLYELVYAVAVAVVERRTA